ncbi:MAG: TAXI family TRAP transporter solute-binding subunit [Hyphomonadaceae bacterium]|jgi:TRAP transporter TAXI family solute receptor|nr:TAXI family TRAP transporter solute-binding subunit [Hyphomonadaceae bacterium]
MKFRALLALGAMAFAGAAAVQAQQAKQLSIATGGTGGIYYPLAGGFGSILAKEIPGITATAEVTGGSIDNMKLVGSGSADVAFTQVDTAVDAVNGRDKFPKKLPIKALVVMYSNLMQVVTLEGNGITKFEDMKGKRISTGAPGSGTEIFAFRVIEGMGLDKDKDMTRERLSAAESGNALKDRKIDAFMFVAGVPTAAITDVAATPGVKMLLVDHDQAVKKMAEKYGPAYAPAVIPKGSYPNLDKESKVVAVWNIMAVRDDFPEDLAYKLAKVMLEKREDLGRVHKEALNIKVENQKTQNVGIPWHPGALKYFAEKGIKVD